MRKMIIYSVSLIVLFLIILNNPTDLFARNQEKIDTCENKSFDATNFYNGLAGYWGFDELSGNIVYDISDNANNGSLIGGPLRTAGILGNSIEFDGIDDYIEVPDSPSLDISGSAITFMAWIYSSGFNEYGWIMGKGNSGSNLVWHILARSNGYIRYWIKSGGVATEREVNAGLTINTWQHVAVVYDGSFMRFYLNAVALDSCPKTGNMDVNDNVMYIGLDGWFQSHHYRGKIDEVKIFNRALTITEIRNEFEHQIVGYWNFDEDSGQVANDISAFHNHGALINGPLWTNGLPLLVGALEFDGVNDYIEIPDSPSLDISGPAITFMAWIYSSGFNEYGWIMGKGNSGGSLVWHMLARSNGYIRYWIKSGGTATEREVNAGLAINTWQHVAVVYDGSFMRFYLNAVALDSCAKTGNMDVNDRVMYIGLDGWNQYNHFHGKIDEVRIYSKALSLDELKIAFRSGFICGDANANGVVNALDITYLINYLYKGGLPPSPLQSGDVTGNGIINALDITYLINYLYKSGPAPKCP